MRSELGGLYDKFNLFAGYGRSDRRSQVGGRLELLAGFGQQSPAPGWQPRLCQPLGCFWERWQGCSCSRLLLCPQFLYPWRRIFKELFVHDRAFGQLYCLREPNPQEQHVVGAGRVLCALAGRARVAAKPRSCEHQP